MKFCGSTFLLSSTTVDDDDDDDDDDDGYDDGDDDPHGGYLVGGVLMKLWRAPTFPLPLHGNVKEERAKSGRGEGGVLQNILSRFVSVRRGGGVCVNEELVMCCVLT